MADISPNPGNAADPSKDGVTPEAKPNTAPEQPSSLAAMFSNLRERFFQPKPLTSEGRLTQVENAMDLIRRELAGGPKALPYLCKACEVSVSGDRTVAKEAKEIALSATRILVARDEIAPAIALNDPNVRFKLTERNG